MQITRSSLDTTPGPGDWFRFAHSPARADDLRDRGRRRLPASRRPDRDDPARGAAPSRFMTHLAMHQADEEGSTVTTDEEYSAAPE